MMGPQWVYGKRDPQAGRAPADRRIPVLDRARLIGDLIRAARSAAPTWVGPSAFERGVLHGMGRAWRIMAAALEDGDYDLTKEGR